MQTELLSSIGRLLLKRETRSKKAL